MTVPLAAYVPFVTPLPVWDYWAWLLLPLCVAVSTIYKTIKCRYVRQVPWEATAITVWILLSMAGVALGIRLVYWLMVQWRA